MSRRMRVLSVISSSNQLYSGIGRALFELSERLLDRADYEFAIDDANPKNLALAAEFARDHGCTLHVGRGFQRPEALDNGNRDLADLLREDRWDAVECVCWANAATHQDLLANLADSTTLIYTPHDQPSWTVPMGPGQAEFTEDVHRRVIRRADLVLCDSTWERREVHKRAPDRNIGTYLPLGCDFRSFRPGPAVRKQQLVFVGDLAEPRKRFDRVVAAMTILKRGWPSLRLVVIGNRSDSALDLVPEALRSSVELRGYVSEEELRRTYAESFGLVLLSDFEAFGIPILEALACGTPVFLTELEATRSLFGPFAGAHFCPGDDVWATCHVIEDALERNRASIAEAVGDRRRLQAVFDWDVLAERKWRAISASWYSRNSWAWTA